MQVVRENPFGGEYSGGRVSNTWAIYPTVGDNPGKPELIPHVAPAWKPSVKAGLSLKLVLSDGLAAYQLVGGVTAYQGDDG